MQAFGMRFLRLGRGCHQRRREYVKEHGLTLCADGFRRLIIRKEKDMATPYKECPHCGAHLDSGEKCECRAEEIETVHSQKCACGLSVSTRWKPQQAGFKVSKPFAQRTRSSICGAGS